MDGKRQIWEKATSADGDLIGAIPTETAGLYLYKPAPVLVCALCKAAIRPRLGVRLHYRKEHGCTGAELQWVLEVAEAAATEMESCGGLADPSRAALREDGSAPIPQLRVQAGFSCTACRDKFKDAPEALGREGDRWGERGAQKHPGREGEVEERDATVVLIGEAVYPLLGRRPLYTTAK